MAIISFASKDIEAFYVTGRVPIKAGWQHVSAVVTRKLDMLNYAVDIKDLRSPPNNQLKELKGDLLGLYSIRINDQWRLIFQWTSKGPINVDVVDYH